MKELVVLIGVVTLSACSVLAPHKSQNVGSKAIGSNGDLYSLPANLRTLDIRKRNSDYIICSEPVPDVAMSNALKLALDASNKQAANVAATVGDNNTSGSVENTLGLNGSSDASTTALELAGRTQIVLLARDFISSNCRNRANGWIDDDEFKTSQNTILKQITSMISADEARAKAEKAKAEAVGAAVKDQLNKKALTNVTEAFKNAKINFCVNAYDDCITKASGNLAKMKNCRAILNKCNK